METLVKGMGIKNHSFVTQVPGNGCTWIIPITVLHDFGTNFFILLAISWFVELTTLYLSGTVSLV